MQLRAALRVTGWKRQTSKRNAKRTAGQIKKKTNRKKRDLTTATVPCIIASVCNRVFYDYSYRGFARIMFEKRSQKPDSNACFTLPGARVTYVVLTKRRL